jgi:hypothetical protein
MTTSEQKVTHVTATVPITDFSPIREATSLLITERYSELMKALYPPIPSNVNVSLEPLRTFTYDKIYYSGSHRLADPFLNQPGIYMLSNNRVKAADGTSPMVYIVQADNLMKVV